MSELKLPTIRPSTPAMMVNASGEDWRSWGNVYIVAVSVKADALATGPGIRHAATNSAADRLQSLKQTHLARTVTGCRPLRGFVRCARLFIR